MAEKTEAPTPRKRDEGPRARARASAGATSSSMGLTLGVGHPGAVRACCRASPPASSPRSSDAIARHRPPRAAAPAGRWPSVGDADPPMIARSILPLACRRDDRRRSPATSSRAGWSSRSGAIRFDLEPAQPDQRASSASSTSRRSSGSAIALAKLAILAVVSLAGRRQPGPGHRRPRRRDRRRDRRRGAGRDLRARPDDHDPARRRRPSPTSIIQRRQAPAARSSMTKDEVKREYREQEGDPQIRGAAPPPRPPDGLRPDDGRRPDRRRHRHQPDPPGRRAQVRLR